MPTFQVTDPQTGRKVKLTGDSPPTEQELNQIFSSIQQGAGGQDGGISGGVGISGVDGLVDQQIQQRTVEGPLEPGQTSITEAEAPAQVPEKGFFGKVGEFITGSERETRATQELPEIGQGGLLFGEDKARAAAITPALLTATDPNELGQILSSNFPSIGITSDEKGNLIANNNKTGAKVILNKPGVSQIDILQGLGITAAFAGAGRVTGALKLAGAAGATSAGIESLQALSGGEFDPSQVAIDTVTAGLLDKAFDVAKATGRKIKDVLRDDARIDPDKLLKSFDRGTESGVTFSAFGTRTAPEVSAIQQTGDIAGTVQRATQADLTPEALDRIRLAESQGIQLTRAQALGEFGPSEAEQTLLKSISPEGEQARQFADQQQEQLKEAASQFTDKFGGSSRLTETLGGTVAQTARDKGEQIQSALKATEKLGREEVSELYTAAAETAGEALPLNNTSIVDIADEVIVNRPITAEVEKSINTALAKFGLIGDSVEQVSRNKFRVIDGDEKITIIGNVEPLSLSNAEEFRKALNKAVGADQTGSAKLVVGELDNQVLNVIEQGAETGRTAAFKTARDAARQQKETFLAKDIVQDLVNFKKGTKTPVVDPETVIRKIAQGDKSVTNIRKIKQVLLSNPTAETKSAWRSIQAETVGDILSQAINKDTLEISGARLNSALKKFKPEALRELLGPRQFKQLKALQKIIGTATIPPPGTTNPSGTFTKLLNMTERLGNFAGAGQINFGSLAVGAVKKGNELAARKQTLDGIINTKIERLKLDNPSLNQSQLQKAAKALAFLEIRELDKENK